MEEKLYWFWLADLNEFGASGIKKLLEYFITPERLFKAAGSDIEFYLKEKGEKARRIVNSRNEENIIRKYNNMRSSGIHFITMSEENYPKRLRNLFDPPFWLFYIGELPKEHKPSIAIIGARICTAYGKEIAVRFAGELSCAGVQVISGMAAGIDGYAHYGALKAGEKTYAILGCGADICYPQENINLYERIQTQGGIISEYAPKVKGASFHFPMRNRIISGLSDGILVIEAREKSGTLITVDYGLEQGKDIFAVPGRPGDKLSVGCNKLIQTGAKLILDTEDILVELQGKYKDIVVKKEEDTVENTAGKDQKKPANRIQKMDKQKINNNLLETEEKIVYASLSLIPKHIETLLYETALPVDTLMALLFQLELKDVIKQTAKNYYIINLH